MNFHVLTLFPEMVENGLKTSIIGKAMESGKISIDTTNIRDFSEDKHKKVDDYPYGGGAGMLMQAQPVYDAYEHVVAKIPQKNKRRVVYVTPQGYPFNQHMAEKLAKNDDLILLCGHYEGIDERVLEEIVTDYVSIGDYVLTGGELAAMVMIDAISRLVPGVLHNEMSAETESFHGYLLEYPQYTRPDEWHEKLVPEILLSGNQKRIDDWKLEQSKKRTMMRRPDLYDQYFALHECKDKLMLNKTLNMDMIESINRGRAILIAREGNNVLIQDKETGYFHHSGTNKDFFMSLSKEVRLSIKKLVLHQEEMVEPVQKLLNLNKHLVCYQSVYTPRERLPITGLYRTDGKPTDSGVVIRQLEMEYAEEVQDVYDNADYQKVKDADYIRERIKKNQMFGAFVNDELAGIIGIHNDDSIGMLYVKEKFRGKRIGTALQTYIINKMIDFGWKPYSQIMVGDEASMKIQKSLNMFLSKTPIIWMS
ncbi:MAG: tRNA (guanosine(37)-N1)-methyltransferase TrmD [Agathobacter sp.]|nr:tRNA (guanosine(37)-N1)-methyltransferase TrmD [Agathobacter sp.]